VFLDDHGRIAWNQNDSGVYELPPLEPRYDASKIGLVETPPGFSIRWKTTVFRTDESAPADVVWLSASEMMTQWRSGEALVEPYALCALDSRLQGHPIAHGVWNVPMRTQTLPPATHTNGYIVGEGAGLLIDPGGAGPDEIESVVAFVRQWVVRNGSLSAIFLTHHHMDHVSGAMELSQRLELPIWAHEETAARVAFSINRVVTDGDRFGAWQAIHTPGHATGHLCLWHADRKLLMAGDMMASVGTIVIDPSDGDMQAYLASLRQLRDLAPRVLYPAHGEPILDPVQRLDGYVAHRLWREAQIVSVLTDTAQSLETITETAYTDVPEAIHWLAQRQALAHLNMLVETGRARCVDDQWSTSPDG
jgi:glyoxylase-like metal-dependent hydrolase (beta-lactamase superfamily II)